MVETAGQQNIKEHILARTLNYKLAYFAQKVRALVVKMGGRAARENFHEIKSPNLSEANP